MKRFVPILLIILGIFSLLTPSLLERLIVYQSKSLLDDELTNEVIKENNKREDPEVEYDFSTIENVNVRSIIKNFSHLNKDLVIGTIFIPDLDMELPIMRGLTEANLLTGVATMQPGQKYGTGNYTLAGHNMQKKDFLFTNLMDIELDTIVYISDGETIYEYRIYETKIVSDTDIDMLSNDRAIEKNKPILSLMTCYHSLKTGKRFFALGELVKQYPLASN